MRNEYNSYTKIANIDILAVDQHEACLLKNKKLLKIDIYGILNETLFFDNFSWKISKKNLAIRFF